MNFVWYFAFCLSLVQENLLSCKNLSEEEKHFPQRSLPAASSFGTGASHSRPGVPVSCPPSLLGTCSHPSTLVWAEVIGLASAKLMVALWLVWLVPQMVREASIWCFLHGSSYCS